MPSPRQPPAGLGWYRVVAYAWTGLPVLSATRPRPEAVRLAERWIERDDIARVEGGKV